MKKLKKIRKKRRFTQAEIDAWKPTNVKQQDFRPSEWHSAEGPIKITKEILK